MAAGNTLPVNSILALLQIFAKETVLEFLGLVLIKRAREKVEGLDFPAVYRIPRSLAVCSTSYCIPDFLRASLISLASLCVEAITDPAPFLDDKVSLSLVVLSLRCVAAARILLKRVSASLCEENWAVSSTWTLFIVAGWLWASTSLTDSRSRLRVMATEWAHPARILLYTGIGWAENPATWITLGAKCCWRAKESSVAGK